MRLLLDTCTFLWLATEDPKLSPKVKALCADRSNDLYLSVVSSWEIALKHSIGQLSLTVPPHQLIPLERKKMGAERLLLRERAVFLLAQLPPLHRDPFDRMLVCQAIAHDLVLLTSDSEIRKYPVRTAWDA